MTNVLKRTTNKNTKNEKCKTSASGRQVVHHERTPQQARKTTSAQQTCNMSVKSWASSKPRMLHSILVHQYCCSADFISGWYKRVIEMAQRPDYSEAPSNSILDLMLLMFIEFFQTIIILSSILVVELFNLLHFRLQISDRLPIL